MLAQERMDIILELLRQRRTLRISDIAQRFGVSNLTARRDLDSLQEQGLVRRVYGGAVLAAPSAVRAEGRRPAVREEMQAIGRCAAEMILPGESLFLGTGSTVLAMTPYLRCLSGLTILTNSLPVVNELISTDNEVYVLGGRLDRDEHASGGRFANEMLDAFCVDQAFIGCGGITPERGITDYTQTGAELSRHMVNNARRAHVVCTGSKFLRDALAVVCPLSRIDTVVTDAAADEELRGRVAQAGPEVRVALPPDDGDPENEGSQEGKDE